MRESDLTLLTQAGPEIGVASTKAFTTQLVALLLLTLAIGQVQKRLADGVEAELVEELRRLPTRLGEALAMDRIVEKVGELFAEKNHTLFLGRGAQYPVAMEGALKLKEISYIHAEAYPAGELKHGPLALVDADMPVVTVAPNNELLEKLKSNLQEVRARGGELIVFAEAGAGIENGPGTHVVGMPPIHDSLAPILYTVPLQLLSYHVAVLKGTDVDQPRNLAKSVTVE
ncbi:Glutamine--fructose-6-phosphate aminotransferase [isomerizing] [compost metagenome]